MSLNAGLFTSNTPEWATPRTLFNELSDEFGGFRLDVCATPKNAKCSRFYSLREDGLKMPWSKRNWMNPPYGRTIAHWIKRAHEESSRGNQTVALLPARTDTGWFQDYIYKRHEIRFLRGRLKFNDGAMPAPFPSMVVVFSLKPRR